MLWTFTNLIEWTKFINANGLLNSNWLVTQIWGKVQNARFLYLMDMPAGLSQEWEVLRWEKTQKHSFKITSDFEI